MAAKPRILIIDDNIDTVELLRKRLRAEGFDTDEAYDGVLGLEKIRAYAPDLILLDIMMPNMNGYEVCEVINSDETIKQIPKIMLTAKSKVPDKVRGLDIGADDYITKPFDFKEVAARIRSLLAKKLESSEIAEQEKFNALDHFLNEVSHEVRNPLVTIGGFARRVKKNLPEGSKNYQDMDIILQNVEVLERMVHKLISLKSANLCYRESSNINEIVNNALSAYHQEIENKNITLITNFMDNPPIICADQENITMTIAHIIENAIEAMVGEKRLLTLSTCVKERFFEIEISDTGKGIEKSKIKNIYDPFFSSKTYGPGFGLTFALKTVRSHNGSISVESTENQGSTFTIRLPMRSVATESR